MKRLAIVATLAAVAVASADSSIVVLALPDLLARFDTSIETVSWVISAYNLAVAAAAFALGFAARRLDPGPAAAAGGALFLLASLGCAAAPGIGSLIALRSMQGLGAALILVAALPLLRSLASTPERASTLWATAGVFGAALGPSLGGLITELLGWRVIFVAQAPVAALFLTAVLGRPVSADTAPTSTVAPRGRRAWAAGAGLVLVSSGLVALLFLAVLELIDVRGYSPLAAGSAASTVALTALAATPLAGLSAATEAGALLLAGGLAGMALVPGPGIVWSVAAFAVAGFGYGLAVPGLARNVADGRRLAAAGGATSVALRHAGLVSGLLLLTPLLASNLVAAGDRAELRGIAVALDAPADISTKLQLTFDLAPLLAASERAAVPDFAAATSRKGRGVAAIGRQVDAAVRATLTGGFRRSFLLASLLALLAAAVMSLRGGFSHRAWLVPATALGLAAALLAADLAGGASTYGTTPALAKPCLDGPSVTGTSTDASAQRAVLSALSFLSCRLHETREQLVANTARHGIAAETFIHTLLRLARLRALLTLN